MDAGQALRSLLSHEAHQTLDQMVCPYRVVMTTITAILSLFWIHKATAPAAATVQMQNKLGGGVDGSPSEQPQPPARKWTAATVLLAVCLILLHVDLLVTGHLRAAVKTFIASR